MSNIWAYEMHLPRLLGSDDVRHACHLAAERGYTTHPANSGVAQVISRDGMDVHEYTRIAEAEAVLATAGGSLRIWKGAVDLALGFHPASNRREEDSLELAPPGWSRVSLTVDGAFFRDEAVRSRVASDLWELFVGLCEQWGVAYGFSRDEEVTEAFPGQVQRLSSAVAAGTRPPLLFWLNYFRREQFPWLDEALFARAGGWVTTFPRGMLVSLADVPWEVDLARLREANRRWSE